ncbi:MAG: hypothetical protein Q7S51_09110 [Gallionellaceae bacterium]|nr:hypothetical protein [Gallionellaceae bacterium]
MLSQPAVVTLNHLLTQSGWALQRLVRFAGKTARFDIAPFSFVFTIQADGTLLAAEPGTSVDASCTIPPALLPRLALHDETAFADIHSEGDAGLLGEIFYLSRHLRWDAAEDLSRIIGDMAAERVVQFARSSQQQLHHSVQNFSQALAEYWTEERPLIAKATQVAAFVRQVDQLRDDVARLEQRINQLKHPSI